MYTETQGKNILSRALLIRLIEEEIAERYPKKPQLMRCPTHLSIGQELVPAVLGELLTNKDLAVSTHRGHAHYLGKGGDPKSMIAEIYGRATGCAKGKGGSMHLIDTSVGFMGTTAIVGGTIPIGVGLGLSLSLQQDAGNVACVFLGDGATEEGVFYESVNFACIQNLPVLFICENNFYSVYSPLKVRQPKNREIYKMVEALGCSSLKGNGNDIEETWTILNKAVEHVRQGKGPFFVELHTFRWREHCGPFYDDNLEYRPSELIETWLRQDPIEQTIQCLERQGFLVAEDVSVLIEEVSQVVQEAFDFAISSPFPEKEDAFSSEYSQPLI